MAENEYIERGALMKHEHEVTLLNGAKHRCIDADAILEVPKSDVVEVVRCKDCLHFCPYDGEEHKGDCNELVGLESCVYEDDFCSYGEAKMDGKGEGE